MSWRDLLQTDKETTVLPWVGGRSLRTSGDRVLKLQGPNPPEHGWHKFEVLGRKASWLSEAEPEPDKLRDHRKGYLVGDRLIPDQVGLPNIKLEALQEVSEQVHLIDPGLDRFSRITVGRPYENGPLIYEGVAFPLGPETDVLEAFLDQKKDLQGVPEVTPALLTAFQWETWQRDAAEALRQEEEARLAKEERRRQIVEHLGDGAGRRVVAVEDFDAAARAALAVGNATFLDARKAHQREEMVVRFRLDGRRFECTCSSTTLRVIDSGICLVDHQANNRKDDGLLTLESLPGVIREADRTGQLVIFRRV